MRNLHSIVENELEAPALAWNILAYYWGMSAFGLGPAYRDYMESDQASIDSAFNDPSNEALNQIAGLERSLTIKERFDRAANFYVYCFEQGNRYAINPPFDTPPPVQALIDSRLKMEARSPPEDATITASRTSLLTPELEKLWALGAKEKAQQRAIAYNERVKDTVFYIAAEIRSLQAISPDQLTETGFLTETTLGRFNVTADLMDQVMPEDVQDKKFGECYAQYTPTETKMILSGIIGAYYSMGHNLEMAMFDTESKTRLGSTHHAIMYTWRQLHDIYQKENS